MEKKIQKLIKEYQKKSADCDIKIDSEMASFKAARKQDDKVEMDFHREERKFSQSQRQCYIQFISDLEGLS